MRKSLVLTSLFLPLAAYLTACGYMYLIQDRLIFKPDPIESPITAVFPDATEHRVSVAGAVDIKLWLRTTQPDQPLLVMFHGNAGNLSTRPEFIEKITANDLNFAVFSWRGFGENPGEPSEQGLYEDARAVLNWLSKRGFKTSNTLIYGESLGTGVAMQMATEFELRGVVLGAPYTRIADVGDKDYWWLPVDLLLNHPFDSISKVAKVEEPVAVLHSEDDRVIPYNLGHRLYESLQSEKTLFSFTDRGHTGFTKNDLQAAINWILTSAATESPQSSDHRPSLVMDDKRELTRTY